MSTTGRGVRVDAVRNRERLLAAAAELFEEKGARLSVDEVAARAGVGTGTFYRNFATRSDLLSALVAQQLDELAMPDEESGDVAEAILRFVRDAIVGSRRKRDLVAALEAAGYASSEEISEASTRFRQRIGVLLTRAQGGGAVRRDIGVEDLLALVSAASSAASRQGVSGERLAAVISDGLRSAPA